jgi:hypothetical protein
MMLAQDIDLNACDADSHVITLNEMMNATAKDAKRRNTRPAPGWGAQQEQWERLLQRGDSRTIWKAIGWNGCLLDDNHGEEPADDEFIAHFEALLFAERQPQCSIDTQDCPYIPLLDDPFSPVDVDRAMKSIKNKAFIGVCGGLFRHLPRMWIMYITQLFNVIFLNSQYPPSWRASLLVVLFKSGSKLQCGNYKGITSMDSTAKLYDQLMNDRLSRWLRVDAAQAGAQSGRGCIEQILTLRLTMDYAKKQKRKLFLLFVDFKKAYDKVPRAKLLEQLKEMGCGGRMLTAISAMYQDTSFIIKSATVAANIGVRQGAPTSCLLFVAYIDKLQNAAD